MSKFDFNKGLTELGEGVWSYIQPDGSWGLSNAGLIVDNGQSLLVDTLYDVLLTEEMLAAMRAVAPDAKSIDYLVNTHDNGDHWFGNSAAAANEIIATSSCAQAMAAFTPEVMAELMKSAESMGEVGQFFLKVFGKYSYEGIPSVLPTRTFDGQLDLEVGSRKIELIEVGPAHTTGDLIVNVPHARTVFAADIMFVGGHQIMWAGPVANFIKAIDLIIDLEPLYIVPGHGPVTNIEGAQELKTYWQYYEVEARKRYDQGMDAFAAARDIPAGPYASYNESEKTVITVSALYKEFSNSTNPLNQVELFAQMSQW